MAGNLRGLTDKENHYRNIGITSKPPHKPLSPSKYDSVDVLLVTWAADDLGVEPEVAKLERVFEIQYNFATTRCILPDREPAEYLTTRLLEFRRGKEGNPKQLLILYYAGHAVQDRIECTWAANKRDDSPTLNFHSVQNLLLDGQVDVAIILDCCYATLAARSYGTWDNWFLGASAKENQTTGVARDSFTSALVRALKYHAQQFWDLDIHFSLQSIHSTLMVYDREIKFTPSLLRLTDHECPPTELTPLKRPRIRAAQTFQPGPSSTASGTFPPRPPQRILSEAFENGPPNIGSLHISNGHEPLNGISGCEDRAVRITGLPPQTQINDVVSWLESHLRQQSVVSRVSPFILHEFGSSNTHGVQAVCVTFSTAQSAKATLNIRDRTFRARAGGDLVTLKIDNQFQGLSCIYASAISPSGNPTIDLVFVHGASGHPIETFTSRSKTSHGDLLWPVDELPSYLEAVGIFPRILTLGYDADVWFKPYPDTEHILTKLRNTLKTIRKDEPRRPMVFIGHGVGGWIVKQAIIDIINSGFEEDDPHNPVTASFFFAVPHQGLDGNNDYGSVLKTMKNVLQGAHVRPGSSSSLNNRLQSLSQQFRDLRSEWGIKVVSFYEGEPIGDKTIVPKEAAVSDQQLGQSHCIDANYHEIVRFSDKRENLEAVLTELRDTLCTRLKLPIPTSIKRTETSGSGPVEDGSAGCPQANDKQPVAKKEKVYERLRKFDTVFLVDDSGSMEGRRWNMTSRALAEIAEIAVQYDDDGVDIQFFNHRPKKEERKGLGSAKAVMDLFQKYKPRDGPTLTADLLEEELGIYLQDLEKDRDIKGLNLIVLTDGEPDEDQDVETVIVDCANQLKALHAPKLKVGIQFVQIGNDEKAREFLRGLDDDLKDKHNLDRDVGL